ncbi:MAG: adenylate/guanylate cyclase domain-containing protein [Burkholderiales bacterium]
MKCPRCQQDNPAHARFCLGCGARLALACGSCGAELPGGARFCLQCGQAVAAGTAAPVRSPAPETYTPKHLAEKILTSKAAIEGERKQVTVLFADLKGSMELLADRDPEEARKLLDPVLERMMEAVHRYEGTVNQVMGDGIMALFGAPLAVEDHAVRACYAALRMQESVKRYAEEARRAHGITVRIRVGLNSGEVVVRAIGSDLHMDYTAVGQTTHLAARMEQFADPGSILLSPATFELTEGFVEVKSLGPVPVKGLPDPVEVYELTGAGTARSRLQATTSRGLTRFVGRDPELTHLIRAQEQARSGRGQVVAIVGEAGVGKSRLYHEFTHSPRVQGWLVLEASAVSHGKTISYLPLIDLLKAYCKLEDRDDHRALREKVTGKLFTLDESLKPYLSAFLGLLEVPVDDPQWQALDPAQRRHRTLDANKRLLLREAQAQPLVVVFEDLHWIDTETQALLDSLVESLPAARMLMLVNYRPEYQHGWGSKTYYTQIRLDALPAESAGELLEGLLGGDPALAPLKALLTARTAGNPLFLEESVRTLVETRALTGVRGAYRLAQPVENIQVPATVQSILASRIDRLPLDEKRLLQSAAVIGKDVPFALLQGIADLPEDELRRGLAHLQAAEFLYETSLFPDLEYTFKHALTHDVAYGSLLQDRRRELHAKVVETIEALYADRLTEQVERLAHHAFRGEEWGKAVRYLRQAGAKAFARSANREAVAYLEQALAALAHLPETRETLAQAIDLRFELRNSLFPLSELEAMLTTLREAERLATALDDRRRLGWVLVLMSQYHWVTGHLTEARAFGERAGAIAGTVGDPSLQAVANYYNGAACFASTDYRKAEGFLRNAVHSFDGDLGRERFGLAGYPAVMSRWLLASSLAERGEFDEGLIHAQEAMRIAEEVGHPYSLILASWGLALLYSLRGDFSHAGAHLERALALCREWNIRALSPVTAGFLGYVHVLSGRVAEGLSSLQQGIKDQESSALALYHSRLIVWLAEALMRAGQLEDARARAEHGLALTRERGERGLEAWALFFLGEIASRREPPDAATAQGRYREALALADEIGLRPLTARCYDGLGKLYRCAGKRQEALEHFATAATQYGRMNMSFWLQPAEAELAALG